MTGLFGLRITFLLVYQNVVVSRLRKTSRDKETKIQSQFYDVSLILV
jgi:hypothetical protein